MNTTQRGARVKPKVGIGITTYQDVRSPDFACSLYDALVAASPKLAPYRVDTLVDRYAVDSPADFATHWCAELRLIAQPKYGVAPSYVAPSAFGANWKVKGTLSGDGEVFFGSRDTNEPATLTLWHNYSARVNWQSLFRQLIDLSRPAHANLHVFTERELDRVGDDRFSFRAPIVGEASFTHWKSVLGDWRGPDPWDVDARRQYRFLPDLAWGNYLGVEFSGRFDRTALIDHSSNPVELDAGILFHVTDDLSDVVAPDGVFEERRAKLRSTFADGVLR